MWKPIRKEPSKSLVARLKAYSLAYRKLPWMIGDAINAADGSRADRYVDELRFSAAQLYDFARVAAMWEPRERLNYELPWTYFRDSGSDKELAEGVLKLALEHGWSRDTVRGAIRSIRERVNGPTEEDRPVKDYRGVGEGPAEDVRLAVQGDEDDPPDSLRYYRGAAFRKEPQSSDG